MTQTTVQLTHLVHGRWPAEHDRLPGCGQEQPAGHQLLVALLLQAVDFGRHLALGAQVLAGRLEALDAHFSVGSPQSLDALNCMPTSRSSCCSNPGCIVPEQLSHMPLHHVLMKPGDKQMLRCRTPVLMLYLLWPFLAQFVRYIKTLHAFTDSVWSIRRVIDFLSFPFLCFPFLLLSTARTRKSEQQPAQQNGLRPLAAAVTCAQQHSSTAPKPAPAPAEHIGQIQHSSIAQMERRCAACCNQEHAHQGHQRASPLAPAAAPEASSAGAPALKHRPAHSTDGHRHLAIKQNLGRI